MAQAPDGRAHAPPQALASEGATAPAVRRASSGLLPALRRPARRGPADKHARPRPALHACAAHGLAVRTSITVACAAGAAGGCAGGGGGLARPRCGVRFGAGLAAPPRAPWLPPGWDPPLPGCDPLRAAAPGLPPPCGSLPPRSCASRPGPRSDSWLSPAAAPRPAAAGPSPAPAPAGRPRSRAASGLTAGGESGPGPPGSLSGHAQPPSAARGAPTSPAPAHASAAALGARLRRAGRASAAVASP